MYKKCIILLLVATLVYASTSYSAPYGKNSNWKKQANNQVNSSLSPQIEFFAGIGYYNPSLKTWNNALKDFNTAILNSGTANLQAFTQVIGGVVTNIQDELIGLENYAMQSSQASFLKGNSINHLGLKYYFKHNISLSLSIAYYTADASTQYFAEAQGVEDVWPNFGYSVSDLLTVNQEIKTYPTLLTVQYNPTLPILKDFMNFYVGGGVGYYFSTVSTGISKNYVMDHSKGNANWEIVDISSDPVNSNIISNIRAKTNPFGYHISAGLNFGFKNIFLNVEVCYNFVKAKLEEEDWTFFTRNYTPIKTFEGKNYSTVNERYETIYQETRKYFLEIPQSSYDTLKITELDFSGFILKGGIGFSF